MASLPWICALTLALLYCLNAQPVRRDIKENVDYILDTLPYLINNTQNDNCIKDLTLYSPTDVTEGCMSTALECIQKELEILKEDCYSNNEIEQQITIIEAYLNFGQTSNSSPACQCEVYKQVDVLPFLKNIEDLVQKLNAIQ